MTTVLVTALAVTFPLVTAPQAHTAELLPGDPGTWVEVPIEDDSSAGDFVKEGYQVEEVGLPPVPEGDKGWSETVSPKDHIVSGEMRSDREEIPAGFTKEEADRAEVLEAQNEISQTPVACPNG